MQTPLAAGPPAVADPSRIDTEALRVRSLRKAFGAQVAVDHLDLVVSRGEAVGLLGPNGAGKTTTLRILSTLLAPDSGEVQVLGLDPRSSGDQLRGSIGVVPQEIALYGTMTAAENLRFFGELAGVVPNRLQERVDWALETAALTDQRAKLVSGFSGGMKRRLNLVVALLHEPELVFLDEPTAGVDPQSRNHIFEEVERLRAETGITLIYTTHQMGEVERLCDRIVVMDRGQCVADGSLDELRRLDAVQSEARPRLLVEKESELERAAAILRENGIGATAEASSADLETIFLCLTGRALRDTGAADSAAGPDSDSDSPRGNA